MPQRYLASADSLPLPVFLFTVAQAISVALAWPTPCSHSFPRCGGSGFFLAGIGRFVTTWYVVLLCWFAAAAGLLRQQLHGGDMAGGR